MRRLLDFAAENAADLLFNLAFCLIVYLIARLLKASPPVALTFAALPLLVVFLVVDQRLPAQLMAALP